MMVHIVYTANAFCMYLELLAILFADRINLLQMEFLATLLICSYIAIL